MVDSGPVGSGAVEPLGGSAVSDVDGVVEAGSFCAGAANVANERATDLALLELFTNGQP
ncbi:hypothetical protein VA596_20950 [Amycolatopsis sp., V23-08]|uniref:Uncharacterized protein n=1 Tax=Amycolatopsis heterodermiae TaxID=3110235 RepID=A0ABU5R9U1_9PSEU|nr:hypothetical protein [Amycolatopsis sp., V23-08]MEA5362016.1 hypothetical protein [Amycolatopsis sp., V23-08]